MLLEAILILVTASIVIGAIGVIINFMLPGYKSLENKKKSIFRNLYEGIAGFFKVLFP